MLIPLDCSISVFFLGVGGGGVGGEGGVGGGRGWGGWGGWVVGFGASQGAAMLVSFLSMKKNPKIGR